MTPDAIPDAAVEDVSRFLYGNMPDRAMTRRALQIALPHLLAQRDADAPDVTDNMTSAGMREWDLAMKDGERHWPAMLTRVFKAMARAALEKPYE